MHPLRVTDIQRTKRGRFSIFIDEEFYCALHVDVYAASNISVGVNVTPQQLEELRNKSEQRITRDRAMRLLGRFSYTEKSLYSKLRERTDEHNAAEAVARMVELGLVNDEDYARRYAADCFNLKGFSHRRTVQELARKGIDRNIIEQVLAEQEHDPQTTIASVIARKYMRYIYDRDNEKGQKRVVNALLRLGYSYGDIRAVIENLLEDENYYDE